MPASQVTEAVEPSERTTFIALGHSYNTIKDSVTRNELIEAINFHAPEYVFILGDCDVWEEQVAEQFKRQIKSKLFFAPGNQDLAKWKIPMYENNVGYLHNFIVEDDCNFVLINSSESSEHINEYLRSIANKLNLSNQTVLLTHHRIWDDHLLSENPYEHNKSYEFSELYPALKALNVRVIVAGNSPRYYFGGKRNNNFIAFWSDVIYGISCYSVGMKADTSRISYVTAHIDKGNICVRPHRICTSKEMILKGAGHGNIHDQYIIGKVVSLYQYKRFWYGFLCAFVLMSIFFFIVTKARKK
ncbi:MAG: metallophosphoesterase [Flavobacteriales bacterium]